MTPTMSDIADSAGVDAVARTLRSLAHPTRVRALIQYKTAELSPTELCARLADPEITLSTLAYHVRSLADGGLIHLTGATPRRGAMEHHYSLTALGEAAIAAVEAMVPAVTRADRTTSRQGRRLEL
jgi:DNA-binding transcriptional ArsR family regulator